jgi:hypothetical protein
LRGSSPPRRRSACACVGGCASQASDSPKSRSLSRSLSRSRHLSSFPGFDTSSNASMHIAPSIIPGKLREKSRGQRSWHGEGREGGRGGGWRVIATGCFGEVVWRVKRLAVAASTESGNYSVLVAWVRGAVVRREQENLTGKPDGKSRFSRLGFAPGRDPCR